MTYLKLKNLLISFYKWQTGFIRKKLIPRSRHVAERKNEVIDQHLWALIKQIKSRYTNKKSTTLATQYREWGPEKNNSHLYVSLFRNALLVLHKTLFLIPLCPTAARCLRNTRKSSEKKLRVKSRRNHRYLIEVDCSWGQFKSAKLKEKNYKCTNFFHNIAKKERD